MTRLLLVACLLGTTAAAQSKFPQPRLAFEVASIKPYQGKPVYSFIFPPGGGFRGILPLEWLIGVAYDVRRMESIVGEPRWARTDYFEIEGKPAVPVGRADTLAMLRTLVEDRFGLVWRLDPGGKAIVYALTMAREDGRLGPGIRPSEPACLKDFPELPPVSQRQLRPAVAVPCGTASTDRLHSGGGVASRLVALTIQNALGAEVVDRTGLTGTFDFYLVAPRGQDPDRQDADESIFTAVQEQLGMKLQHEEVQRDLFVVEQASRPRSN
jgi:uncharacterized protein (TIGR03435 family)